MKLRQLGMLAFALLGIGACKREHQGEVEISYKGHAVVDEEGMIWCDFHYVNNSPNDVISVALVKDGPSYFCVYPQFEYRKDGKWNKIEIYYAGAPDPIFISPSQNFSFKAPMESLYRTSQKQEYRILVDKHVSDAFSFDLSKTLREVGLDD